MAPTLDLLVLTQMSKERVHLPLQCPLAPHQDCSLGGKHLFGLEGHGVLKCEYIGAATVISICRFYRGCAIRQCSGLLILYALESLKLLVHVYGNKFS